MFPLQSAHGKTPRYCGNPEVSANAFRVPGTRARSVIAPLGLLCTRRIRGAIQVAKRDAAFGQIVG